MSDIASMKTLAEGLREIARLMQPSIKHDLREAATALDAAAAEIERLRGGVEIQRLQREADIHNAHRRVAEAKLTVAEDRVKHLRDRVRSTANGDDHAE
jgi:hypothetical protein